MPVLRARAAGGERHSPPGHPDAATPRPALEGLGRGVGGVGQSHGLRKPAADSTFWPSADCTSAMNALAATAFGAFFRRTIG